MNYVRIAKFAVPVLLGLAGVLGYQDAVNVLKSTVCAPSTLAPLVMENPDAG